MKLLRLFIITVALLAAIYFISGTWEAMGRGIARIATARAIFGTVALTLGVAWLLEEARRKVP